jgi:hypothetical protein
VIPKNVSSSEPSATGAEIAAEAAGVDQVFISEKSDRAASLLRGTQKGKLPLSNADIVALSEQVASGTYARPALPVAEAILRFEGRIVKRLRRE